MIDTLSIRNSILRLGFSGKLTSQQNTDEKVSDMLSRINPKKDIVQTENTPYEIPQTWSWVKLSDLYSINPKVEASESDEAAFIPMEKICPGFTDNFTYEVQSWAKASKNHTKFRDEDVAFAKISPCFENRKSFIARNLPNGIGGGTTELIILRQPEMLPEYTYYLVLDQRFINTGAASYKGTVGQQRVQSDVIKNYLVPVPPFSEQKRIINIVSEAFSILDAIDELQNQYASNQEALKNKLIDAAIQGKLTEQFTEDGTAEELYQTISEKKKEMQKRKEIKNSKPLPEISKDEIPFEVPSNWKWVHLDDITTKITSGSTPTGGRKSNAYVESGNCFFREQNIYNDGIHEEGMVYITDELLSTRENSTVIAKDILLNITGGSIGRCALIPDDFGKGSINQHILIIRMVDDRLRFYVHKLLCSPYAQRYIKDKSVGDKDGFSGGRCKQMLIPIPPLAEQQRIAEKIDEVLSAISMAG